MAEQLEEEPSCHMQDPYLLRRMALRTMATLHKDTDVLLYSETIATIVTPTSELKKKYETLLKEFLHQRSACWDNFFTWIRRWTTYST